MDKEKIKTMMHDVLNDEIPPSQIQLWLAVKAGLVAEESMTSDRLRRARHIAFAVLVVLSLLSVALITPQGRAFAQAALKFFTRASNYSFPLQPVPEETPNLESDKVNTLMVFNNLTEAEDAVGFDAVGSPKELQGYGFRSFEANPALGILIMSYDAEGGGGELSFAQSLSGFPSDSWSEVPPTAIEKIIVGRNEGEYAQGMFVVLPGADSATWQPDAPVFRLRWKDGDRLFSLEKMGDTFPTEWLDKQAMIALAQSLVEQP
jgi:hypothetical protein